MQFAGPAIIVQTIRGVRVLLDFKNYRAGADGMDRAGIHVDQVAGVEVNPVEQLLHPDFADSAFNFSLGYSRLQPKTDLRSRRSLKYVPALRLATWFAYASSGFIVGMDLDGKLFQGKEKLEKQRKAFAIRRGFSKKV